MEINFNEKFEDHVDSLRFENTSKVHKIENISDDDYDDLFEKRLKSASEYAESESTIDDGANDNKQENENAKNKTVSERHWDKDDNLEKSKMKKCEPDIVFKGVAKENPEYGEGGGKQYFIRDFGDMKRDGRMEKVGEKKLEYTGPLIKDMGKITHIEKQEVKYNYSVDISPLSNEEKEEWAQLDKETRKEQGLSRVMPDIESQIIEDRKNPWSDQEDSNGSFFPDAYFDPREIQTGETYYQLRPIGAKYDSSYVTDKKTIEMCMGENGEVDVSKLLQKLQIRPSSVREYILTQYVYKFNGEKNESKN